ncbi:MAG: glycosyl hydrolase [Bdellovibrionales bacterium]
MKRIVFPAAVLLLFFITCSSASAANGSCGASSGAYLTGKPNNNLCSVGKASSVSGSGPWTWSCAGTRGGSKASCKAYKRTTILQNSPVNITAQSGQSFNITYKWNASPMAGAYMVAVHFQDAGGNIIFQDDHTPTVSTSKWSGSLSYKRTVAVPATVPAGTYSIVLGVYYASGSNYVFIPLTPGSGVSTFPGENEYKTGTLTVQASTPVATNGQCGSSNNGTFTTAPTTNLCSAGTASGVSGTGPWAWTCAGINGGTNASCSASKTLAATDGQCGSSNNGTFTTAPTTNLCSAGTASGVSGTGPWAWTCAGVNGGTNASCSASKTTSTCTMKPTRLALYVGFPDTYDANTQASFVSGWNSFSGAMQQNPEMMLTYVDRTHPRSQWIDDQVWWNALSWHNTTSPSLANVVPVLGVPMASYNGNAVSDFRAIAAGSWDQTYNGIFQAWADAGYHAFYIRPGWEMNGNWYDWGVTQSNAADFAAAFRRIAQLAKAFTGADITVVWNPNVGQSATAIQNFYPGDAYVDIIGIDIYGMPLQPDSVINDTASGPSDFTFKAAIAFAKAHNKPFAIPETSSMNAVFPINLANVIANEGVVVDFVGIWDQNDEFGNFKWDQNASTSAAWRDAYNAIAQASAAVQSSACNGQ